MQDQQTQVRGDARWIASPDVVASPVSGELALLDMKSDTYFTLNGSGAKVWSMLDRPRTAAEITRGLAEAFELAPESCADDAEALLATLHENGLIRPVEGGAGA